MVTNLGVMRPDENGELVLTAMHPGVTYEQVAENTGWPLKTAADCAASGPRRPTRKSCESCGKTSIPKESTSNPAHQVESCTRSKTLMIPLSPAQAAGYFASQNKTRKDKMKKECHILATLDLSKDSRKRIAAAGDGVHLTVIPATDDRPTRSRMNAGRRADILYTWNVLTRTRKGPQPEMDPVQQCRRGLHSWTIAAPGAGMTWPLTSMSGAITSQIAEYVLMTHAGLRTAAAPKLLERDPEPKHTFGR